jgi:transposase
VEKVVQQLLETQMTEHIGAAPHERSEKPTGQRNGHKRRTFSEGLSDRQAAEVVRARIDWKYALGLQLSDPGFNFSVLSEFRSRLLEGGKERLLLEKLLEGCKERGYLKMRGR